MTDEKKERIVGPLMVQFHEAKQNIAYWLNAAERLGITFKGLGEPLTIGEKVENIALNSYRQFLSEATYQEIAEIQTNLKKAREASATAAEKLKSMGFHVE